MNTVEYESQEALDRALAEQRKKDTERTAEADTPERREWVAEMNREYGFDEDGRDTSYDSVQREKDDDDDSK